MGKKYASYHIRTDEKSITLSNLKEYLKTNDKTTNNIMRAIQVFSNPEAKKMFERFHNLYKNEIYIVLTEKFISIYDESVFFQSINEMAKKLSKKIDNSILYVSNFDDDLLLIGIVKSGKTYAKKHIGENAVVYDIKLVNNIKKIHDLKEFDYLEKNLKFEKSNDIDECENSIEKELGITLKFKFDDSEEQNQYFNLIEEDSLFKIYQGASNSG